MGIRCPVSGRSEPHGFHFPLLAREKPSVVGEAGGALDRFVLVFSRSLVPALASAGRVPKASAFHPRSLGSFSGLAQGLSSALGVRPRCRGLSRTLAPLRRLPAGARARSAPRRHSPQ